MVETEIIVGAQEASATKSQTEGKKVAIREKTKRRVRREVVPSFAEEKTALAEDRWDRGEKKNEVGVS